MFVLALPCKHAHKPLFLTDCIKQSSSATVTEGLCCASLLHKVHLHIDKVISGLIHSLGLSQYQIFMTQLLWIHNQKQYYRGGLFLSFFG